MKLNKELLCPGDILLLHDKGFSPIAWAIREVTNSYWNHAALYTEDGFVVEAVGKVIKAPIEKYSKDRFDFKVVRVKDSVFKDRKEYEQAPIIAISRVTAEIGKGYDYAGVVWLGLIYIFKAGLKKIRKNPFNSRQKFFCSELVAAAYAGTSSIYQNNLFAGEKSQDISTTTPKDIAKSKTVFKVDGVDKL